MNNLFKKFSFNKDPKAPYLGVEKAPRPYRDWYVMVTISLVFLIGMIIFYGYMVIKVTDHRALSGGDPVESFLKTKPADLDKLVTKIKEKEVAFLELVSSSTPVVDPSR